ncbi:hypothetical protein DP939_44310 [Spongiactinospora rosea]|uniref:Endonuclease/exonuclease/phosphatase domain-containing protein n=1 Tax=Spongiactinospora rosea TaxID=2248750 RepID=A0A366LG99_9ACTN|nr:hypothetical protein [Spongiactinospora rosea]RBQ12172.1 hypothetical protein DP939_44310 [Spongiactinospora rosea]
MKLTVVSYNLKDGGIDDGNKKRFFAQIDRLAGLDADLIGVQEAKYWRKRRHGPLHEAADRLGMTGIMVRSNHHGCDTVILIRKQRGLRVIRTDHDRSGLRWHALAAAELAVEGRDRPLWFLNTHFAPSSPLLRQIEAETLDLFRDRDAILVGDFNGAAAGETVTAGPEVHPAKARRKADRGAAEAIEESGFIDIAALWGDATPTVSDPPYRADRIYTTLPAKAVQHYQAIKEEDMEEDPHSDHFPVLGVFDV